MVTYFNSANVSKRHFAIIGKTTDKFCDGALQLRSLDEVLHSHLKKLGYQRVVLFDPNIGLFCMDDESFEHTQDFGVTPKSVRSDVSQQERQIKLGPLSKRVPVGTSTPERKNKNPTNSLNLRVGKGDAMINIMDKYMKDTSVKTALVIIDTDFFITSFREVIGEGGRLIDITRMVNAKMSGWNRNRDYTDENIVIWIFQEDSADRLAERLEHNDIWDRFFAPLLSPDVSSEIKKRKGTIIDIPTASAGEIKNLINYHRIKERVNVDMAIIDYAAQELEKLTRGQSAYPDDDSKMMDLHGLSKEIISTISSGGITAENLESMCGKRDRVSAFDKIENDLSGMIDIKKYISKLRGRIAKANIKKETAAIYRDRLMRHRTDIKEKGFKLHLALVGNPGTGKTTVAKLMGEIYFELGLLPTGHVVKVTRDDLVAGYIGQTAIKTKERINAAMGGVLFIDEAYTLARGGENDYGQEAIDTILEAMTDRMGEFAVIVAGYTKEIDMLLAKNPGFVSRFELIDGKYTLEIEDYSANELVEIFIGYLAKEGMQIDGVLSDELEGFMQRYYDDTPKGYGGKWANARTVLSLANEMKQLCDDTDETTVGIQHIPEALSKYLSEGCGVRSFPQALAISQLRLPQVEILKTNNEVNIEKMEQSVLFIENNLRNGDIAHGTGFLITPNGHMITCNHVIKDAKEIKARVRLKKNGIFEDAWYKCELMNTNEALDIALLKIESSDLPYLNLETDMFFDYEKGKGVCLSGYPFGTRTAHDCTYTDGKISSTRVENEIECINMDISGKCGNSGGAVIDKSTGRVIGVFIGSITEGEGLVEEINYMRPIKYFLRHFIV